jgi:superoxide dismutase, Fe-Mn family
MMTPTSPAVEAAPNLTPGVSAPSSRFAMLLKIAWGSFKAWQDEFRELGQREGVGWVILHMDPVEHQLSNDWVGLREAGHPSGFIPLLVMDVQDHAWSGMTRSAYVEAFLENIDWTCVENRHASA